MSKEELLLALENGMTVGDLINKLSTLDKNLIVINSKGKDYLPIDSVEETTVDYCYDEVISRKVVSIW